MDECADCGARHDQKLTCKIPDAPFYAGCDDPWVREYYQTRWGQKVSYKHRRDVIWVVPCQWKVEQSVVFRYMLQVIDAKYLTSFPGGLRKDLRARRVMKGYTPATIILATSMAQLAIDWIDEAEYLEIVDGELELMRFNEKYDPPAWDYKKTVCPKGHKRSDGTVLCPRRIPRRKHV